MKNITLLTGFVLLVSAVSLRAQLMSPSVSGGINGNQARVPGQSFVVNVTIGGTRSDATHDHTYNVEVYFSSRLNDITSPAARLADIPVVLPGNMTMSNVVNQTFVVPTTFNGSATTAGSYYIILRLPGTQSTAIQSISMSVVVADISVEAPSGTILTDGASTVNYGPVGTIYTNPIDFIIRNTGSADLTPLAANVTGTNAGDFTFDSPLATSLPPSQGSTLLRVRFRPSSEGLKTAVLHITSNVAGAKSSFDVNLSGTGVVLPAVSTLAATDITTTGAVVHGTVNPNGGTVSLDFLYSLSGVAGTTKITAVPPSATGSNLIDFAVTLTNLQPGKTYAFSAEAFKSTLSTTGNGKFFTTFSSNLEAWRQRFYPGSTATTGPGADLATPLGDGVPNIIKFATGQDPTKPGSAVGEPSFRADSLVFTFTPSHDAIVDGLLFQVEYCEDLAANNWQPLPLNQGALGSGGNPVSVTIPAGSSGKSIARLRVTVP